MLVDWLRAIWVIRESGFQSACRQLKKWDYIFYLVLRCGLCKIQGCIKSRSNWAMRSCTLSGGLHLSGFNFLFPPFHIHVEYLILLQFFIRYIFRSSWWKCEYLAAHQPDLAARKDRIADLPHSTTLKWFRQRIGHYPIDSILFVLILRVYPLQLSKFYCIVLHVFSFLFRLSSSTTDQG